MPHASRRARHRAAIAVALLCAVGPVHAASHRIPLPTTHNAIPGADGDTTDLRLSDDGTRELLRSAAGNLVPGMSAGRFQLFLREGDSLQRLAPGIGGTAPNADVLGFALSRDGTHAAFLSRASNLVPGDSGTSLDLFRLHIDDGTLERFPLTQGARLSDNDRIELNLDGSRACLVSPASLVAADTAGYVDAYLLNFDPPLARRMSDAAGSANGNGHVVGPCRFAAETPGNSNAVVFASAADNLVAGDSNGNVDVFLRSTSMTAAARVSLTHTGAQSTGGDNGDAWLRPGTDGRLLFWRACATDIVPNDDNGHCDIFRRNIDTGAMLRMSRGSSSAANGPADRLVVSPDGGVVAFRSRARNLANGNVARPNAVVVAFENGNGLVSTVLLHADADASLLPAAIAMPQGGLESHRLAYASDALDADTAPLTALLHAFTMDFTPRPGGLASRSATRRSQGTATSLRRVGPNGDILGPALSGDGRHLAFYSLASNLDAGEVNAHPDLYLYDLRDRTLHAPAAPVGTLGDPAIDTHPPAIAHDGTRIAFVGDGLLTEDDRLGSSIYLWTRDAEPALTLLSRTNGGDAFDGHSNQPAMDAAGTRVVFTSNASNTGDPARTRHVYLHDVDAGTTTRISGAVFGDADGDSFDPQISADGRLVTFCSRANNLVSDDANPDADLFLRHVESGVLQRIDIGHGARCHSRLAPSGDLVLNNGLFFDPITGATPDAVGQLELGRRPQLDFSGRIAAGIEELQGPGIDGLVRVKRVFGPPPTLAPIGPADASWTVLGGQQGELALSHDGRTLFLTSRAALDPAAQGVTRMRHLYRHLPFDIFFDGLED